MKNNNSGNEDIFVNINRSDNQLAELKEPLISSDKTVTIGKAMKEVAVLALPYAVADGILLSIAFINSKILEGIASEEGLAAGALTGPTLNLTFGFTIMSLYAVSINIGQAIGENNPAKVGVIYRQGMIFAVLLSAPAIGVLLLSGPIFRALKQPEQVAEIAAKYLCGYAIGYLPGLGYAVEQQLALGLNKPYSLVVAAMGNTALGAGFGYAFAFGKSIFPKWGAFGLGFGNALSNIMTLLGYTLYFKRKEFAKYHLFQGAWIKSELIKLMKIGLPIGTQVCAELGSLLGLSALVGKQGGVKALDAEQIGLLYMSIFSIPTQVSIAQAAGILVGKAFAENQFMNSRRYGNVALSISVGISGLCLIGVIGFNQYLIEPFVENPNDRALISTASNLLVLNTATQILDAFRNITGGSLRGYGDVNSATVWGILSNTVIALPLAYALGFYTDLNTLGMFAARTIGIGIGAAAMSYRWWKKSANAEQLMPRVSFDEMNIESPQPETKKGVTAWFSERAGSLYNYLRGSANANAEQSVSASPDSIRLGKNSL